MPGRTFQAGSASYRYSINGQEKTPEIASNTTVVEFWQYDARIVRRWNVDPVYKHSPYECFGGNPIWLVDKNGADSTVYLFSYTAKNKGTSVDGPGKDKTQKILNNVKKIFEANGINNLKYKMINQQDYISGKVKLDPTDAIIGLVGTAGLEPEGASYIGTDGTTPAGSENSSGFRFPHYSYFAGNDHASKSKSDPVATTAFGVAHEILHQYILKADKVFLGQNAPSSSHYDASYNLNATGYKMGSYLEGNQISSQTLLIHTSENTVGYIMQWQRIYINGYFKAVNAGVSAAGKDAGKESSWKYIFNSTGALFRMQVEGLKSFRNSMVGDKPSDK